MYMDTVSEKTSKQIIGYIKENQSRSQWKLWRRHLRHQIRSSHRPLTKGQVEGDGKRENEEDKDHQALATVHPHKTA